MSILNFVNGLIPSFGKKDVREKINVIGSKINEIAIPMIDNLLQDLNEAELKSAYGKKLSQLARNPHEKAPYLSYTKRSLESASKLTDLLQDFSGKHLGADIRVEGLTYQKANFLRLVELLDFFVDYSIRQMTFLVASESNIEAFGHGDGNPFTQAELRFLDINQSAWFRVAELLQNDPKTIVAKIEKVPEVLLADGDPSQVPALAGGNADPLRMGFIPGVSHIFHWLGMRKVDWELARYDRAMKEKRDVELRLEALRQRRSGQIDARTESIITNYEKELTILRARIADMEDRAR